MEIDRLKTQLSSGFEMRDLGEVKKILGIEIKRNIVKGRILFVTNAVFEDSVTTIWYG